MQINWVINSLCRLIGQLVGALGGKEVFREVPAHYLLIGLGADCVQYNTLLVLAVGLIRPHPPRHVVDPYPLHVHQIKRLNPLLPQRLIRSI